MEIELGIGFYNLVGYTRCIALPSLFLIGLVLLYKNLPREKASKILFYPCVLCAVLSLMVFYLYAMEFFIAYYSGAKYEMEAFKLRMFGPYWYAYFLSFLCAVAPSLFFFRRFRRSLWAVLVLTVLGMMTYFIESWLINLSMLF